MQRDWFVVFEVAEEEHWHNKYLKMGYSHCYCIYETSGNWIAIHPHWSHTEIDISPLTTFPTIRDYAGIKARVIAYTSDIDPLKHCCTLGIMTCVDVVKRHLGIRAQFVFTPYQLYIYLRNHHG